MRIDLHIHTDASDGCDNPRSLLEKAAAVGLKLIAVTDHDSVDNVRQTQKLSGEYGIKVLAGVEISSTTQGKDFHILGYNIDIDNKVLREVISYNKEILTGKDVETVCRLQELGWPVNEQEYREYMAPPGIGGWQALNYLKHKGLCSGVEDFFRRIYIKENGLGFPTFVSSREVISCIHQAGGNAILAHAGSSFHGLGLPMPLNIFAKEDLDGFEVYHPGHGEQVIEILSAYCKEQNLLTTAGSDYHGEFAPGRKLGIPAIYSNQLNLQGLI